MKFDKVMGAIKKFLADLIKKIPFTTLFMEYAWPYLTKLTGGWAIVLKILKTFIKREVEKVEEAADSELGKVVKREDLKEGIRDVEEKHDQRKLEEAIGSDNAGKPAEHRDGVQECRTLDCD